MRDVVAGLGAAPAELVALTMTAELSDAFRTKREGVALRARRGRGRARRAGPGAHDRRASSSSVAEARARPLDVAAANWVASALAVGARHPDALMLDVGSTTADVIPIAAGRVAAAGRTDLDRLLAGELVYTGALRTNLAAIAPRVPVRGRLVPGRIRAVRDQRRRAPDPRAPRARGLHVPDAGRASRRASSCARERVARLVCADAEQLAHAEVEAIAAYLHAEQVAPDRGGGAAGGHALRGARDARS